MKVKHNAIDQIRIEYTNGTDKVNGPGYITINELANGEIHILFDQFYQRKIFEVKENTYSSGLSILISNPKGIEFK